MRRMDYKYLLESESNTFAYSNSYLRGFARHAPKVIDTLLQIGYFSGDHKDIKTLDGEYHSYCFYQYAQAPYSFRACFLLYNRGYYFEACFIIRHLVESLVKMKYLKNHKEKIKGIWMKGNVEVVDENGKKRRLTLKEIFEEVSPGYYKNNYGRFLSGAHHGGVASLLFRVSGIKDKNLTMKMGSVWDEEMATYVVNSFTAIGYAYLICFSSFFPGGFNDIDPDFLVKYVEITDWLKLAIEAHKKANPKSITWYKEMNGIMKP